MKGGGGLIIKDGCSSRNGGFAECTDLTLTESCMVGRDFVEMSAFKSGEYFWVHKSKVFHCLSRICCFI